MPSPYADTAAIKQLALLLQQPHTIRDAAALLGKTERTIYRYIRVLERNNFDLVRRQRGGESMYECLSVPEEHIAELGVRRKLLTPAPRLP